MGIERSVDLAIKREQTGQDKQDKYYEKNKRKYYNYEDNKSWELFKAQMPESFFEQFKNGAGDELGLKESSTPPKMACFGSSSRMLYLLSRENTNFCFEKKLATTIGGTANLDGYLYKDNTHYYIEAKCRELYSATSFIMSEKYRELYKFLCDECSAFKCEISDAGDKKIKTQFYINGKVITHFDIKQMICHLLAVATERLRFPTDDNIVFIYLIYNPQNLNIDNEKDKEKILEIYKTEVDECGSIPFESLYKGVVKYLYEKKRDKLKIKEMGKEQMKKFSDNFTFKLCDQKNYKEVLK